MSSTPNITPEAIGFLAFVTCLTVLGVFIVPPLVDPNSSRAARPLCVVALICGLIVSAFIASFAALHGSADNRPTLDGRFYAEDHGTRNEISATSHKISSVLEVAFGVAAPVLAVCLFALSRIKRDASNPDP